MFVAIFALVFPCLPLPSTTPDHLWVLASSPEMDPTYTCIQLHNGTVYCAEDIDLLAGIDRDGFPIKEKQLLEHEEVHSSFKAMQAVAAAVVRDMPRLA